MKNTVRTAGQSLARVSKSGLMSLVIAASAVGATSALQPEMAQAANPADIAQLTETGICKGCDLSGADLTGQHLIGADLREADLTGATLAYANLEGADLTGALLVNTDLSNAFLTNALLDDAVISNVDLSDSTLIYTSMEDTEVNNVDLAGANVISTPISIGGSYDQ